MGAWGTVCERELGCTTLLQQPLDELKPSSLYHMDRYMSISKVASCQKIFPNSICKIVGMPNFFVKSNDRQ